MDRRYRMELQMVRVPVVWRAKIPEKKLHAKRKMTNVRKMERAARIAAHEFFDRLFGKPIDMLDKLLLEQAMPYPKMVPGRIISWSRYRELKKLEDDNGPLV